MKPFLILLALVACITVPLSAQDKLPKIRYTQGFWTDRYELGEKDVKKPDIRLHLQKHNNEAYYQFRRSESLEVQGVIWMLVGSIGSAVAIIGATKNDPNVPLVASAAGVGVIGYTATIICFSVASGKNQKAIDLYNRAAGY